MNEPITQEEIELKETEECRDAVLRIRKTIADFGVAAVLTATVKEMQEPLYILAMASPVGDFLFTKLLIIAECAAELNGTEIDLDKTMPLPEKQP